MSKQKNPNIGSMVCGQKGCDAIVAVRRNAGGKLYYDCPECGRITPNHPAGQDRILENATIWGCDGMPPAETPKWIAEQWPYMRSLRDPDARKPYRTVETELPQPEESQPQEQPQEKTKMPPVKPPKAKRKAKAKPTPAPQPQEQPREEKPAEVDWFD